MRNCFLFMVTLLCLFISRGYADQSNAKDYLEKTILKQLSSSGDSSITGVDGEKYYVDLERISLSENGIYLTSDFFGLVPLLNLIQDGRGVYTRGLSDHYMCDNCGTCYQSDPSVCIVCGETSFTRIDNTED